MNGSDPAGLQEIIDKAKKGDKEAFSFLYTAYFTPLYKYIYFRVGSRADAEDLTQDVFVKAYSSFGRYSYSGTSPLAYFYTIARNTVIDFRRKKKMIVADDEEMLAVPDTMDNAEEEAIKREDANMVRKNIARLPEDQQDAIVLRFIDGLSTKEISAMLGKNEEAIRKLQSRGLQAMRKNISHE
jgi:RNA polymerase sigma-70 factor (ECF subfamily)